MSPSLRRSKARASPPPLRQALAALRRLYGKPEPPTVIDPFELILYENVAYLVGDARREAAFRKLEATVGLSPHAILSASPAALLEVARAGILPEKRARRLREIAEIALEEFGGDVAGAARRPPKEAATALKKFPSIGDPGAEKILLFSRSHPVLALDSNGLRVLLRLGFGKEEKSYAKSYRSAQEAADPEIQRDCDRLIEVHQLLRRHGQDLCRRSVPRCEICPLRSGCVFGRARRVGGSGR